MVQVIENLAKVIKKYENSNTFSCISHNKVLPL